MHKIESQKYIAIDFNIRNDVTRYVTNNIIISYHTIY